MASKRRRRRKACEGKRRFEVKAEAVLELKKLWRKDREPMKPYLCQWCRGWHIGHHSG